MPDAPKIYKTNGDLVPFKKSKVKESLIRSGAEEGLSEEIASDVAEKVEEKMSTTDIYSMAYSMLEKRQEDATAARYSLKRSLMKLGPTGYPFESFVGEIMREKGFGPVNVGTQMEGICVSHEVDVVAKKENKHYLMECKFHHKTGVKTGVKVPMYINSRFEDIEKKNKAEGKKEPRHNFWVVTNTRFTDDAIEFGECMDMNLLGWRYPEDEGLEKWIEDLSLHPVTCLTTLNEKEKNKLLERKLVLCSDLADKEDLLSTIGLSKKEIEATKKEVNNLCNNHN
ncbi:MAG: ATP cone domain-containing protein [Candidatus Magasanikbacteria bacterium]